MFAFLLLNRMTLSENQQFAMVDSTDNKLNYRHAAFEEENNGLLPMTKNDLKPKSNITTTTNSSDDSNGVVKNHHI